MAVSPTSGASSGASNPTPTGWQTFLARAEMPAKKIAIWIVFNIFFTMLPFLFVYFDISIGMKNSPGVTPFLAKGELLIVIVAITADVIGEIVINWNKFSFIPRLLIISISVGLILWSSYAFAKFLQAMKLYTL